MKAPLLLLLIIVGVSGVYSGHSFQCYDTGVSVPGHGLPQYISVGYVDGIEIARYSSDVGRLVPVAPWMKKVEDPDYWERQTQINKNNAAVSKQHVEIVMNRYNQTGGFHIVQRMYGCELRDDGSTRGYMQDGYDGKDFLALDTERGVFYPLTDQAQLSAQKWNSPELRAGEIHKKYLENICINWLRKYLEYGKEELEKRVRPEVKVSDQTVNGVTKLHCQVYGFYPRDVDVNWQKNGTDVPSYEAKHVLPNSDGTYQIRVTVEVPAQDKEGYSCHVDHASLDQTLAVKWEPQSSMLWIVIGVLAGVTGIAAVGFIIWMMRSGKKTNYAPTKRLTNSRCIIRTTQPFLGDVVPSESAVLVLDAARKEAKSCAQKEDLSTPTGSHLPMPLPCRTPVFYPGRLPCLPPVLRRSLRTASDKDGSSASTNA